MAKVLPLRAVTTGCLILAACCGLLACSDSASLSAGPASVAPDPCGLLSQSTVGGMLGHSVAGDQGGKVPRQDEVLEQRFCSWAWRDRTISTNVFSTASLAQAVQEHLGSRLATLDGLYETGGGAPVATDGTYQARLDSNNHIIRVEAGDCVVQIQTDFTGGKGELTPAGDAEQAELVWLAKEAASRVDREQCHTGRPAS